MQRFVQQMVKKFDKFNVLRVARPHLHRTAAHRPAGRCRGVIASERLAGRDLCRVRVGRPAQRFTGAPCGLHTYSKRGWCRTEILAKVCSHRPGRHASVRWRWAPHSTVHER